MTRPLICQSASFRTAGRAATIAALSMALLAPSTIPASAQGGWWPWAGPSQPPPPQRQGPIPREPVFRGPPGQVPAPIPGPGGPPPGYAQKAPICLQLEQRLAAESQRGTLTRDQLPKIEGELRLLDRANQQSQAQLERSDCFDYFLFSKTLRRTRQCVDLAGQVDAAKRKLAELDAQRQQILGVGDRSHQDDIIRELARNNCGGNYSQEAQRRGLNNPFSTLWQDEDTGPSGRGSDFGALPFATYRTVCVRLCDGYFFPVSFSTLPNHFPRDVDACQSKCAAPAELYYYQNPGGTIEQAVSVKGQQPYTTLKTAKRYQKEYVQGCSCKQTEYLPSPADRGDRKAEAVPAPPPTLRQSPR